MNSILFCKNKYAFGILEPIRSELKNKGYEILWYVDQTILNDFPYKSDPHYTSIKELKSELQSGFSSGLPLVVVYICTQPKHSFLFNGND